MAPAVFIRPTIIIEGNESLYDTVQRHGQRCCWNGALEKLNIIIIIILTLRIIIKHLHQLYCVVLTSYTTQYLHQQYYIVFSPVIRHSIFTSYTTWHLHQLYYSCK